MTVPGITSRSPVEPIMEALRSMWMESALEKALQVVENEYVASLVLVALMPFRHREVVTTCTGMEPLMHSESTIGF